VVGGFEERRGGALVLLGLVVVPNILPVAGVRRMVSITRACAMVRRESGGVGDGRDVIAIMVVVIGVDMGAGVGRRGGRGIIKKAHEIGVCSGAMRGHRGGRGDGGVMSRWFV
jgi:hypothetical protein